MSEPNTKEVATGEAIAPPPRGRFRLGVGLVVAGFLSPFGVLLLPFMDLSLMMAVRVSLVLVAIIPDVFIVVGVVVLGKDGFTYVKNRIMALLRPAVGYLAPAKEVGPTRYYVGLTMLFLPAVLTWPIVYAPDWIPGYAEYRIPINLTLDFLFICSFFVLGGEFWDKLRALFIHKATAGFPEPAEA